MPNYDASTAKCVVLTFKEGLLSAIAHDLQIEVTSFELDIVLSPFSVAAHFEAASLRVTAALKQGRPAVRPLSAEHKRKIERHIRRDVLHVDRYPDIRFESHQLELLGDRAIVSGSLTLHGRTRPIRVAAVLTRDHWVASASIQQPDFGLTPFTAMLGTLKVQPTVDLRLTLPASELAPPSA